MNTIVKVNLGFAESEIYHKAFELNVIEKMDSKKIKVFARPCGTSLGFLASSDRSAVESKLRSEDLNMTGFLQSFLAHQDKSPATHFVFGHVTKDRLYLIFIKTGAYERLFDFEIMNKDPMAYLMNKFVHSKDLGKNAPEVPGPEKEGAIVSAIKKPVVSQPIEIEAPPKHRVHFDDEQLACVKNQDDVVNVKEVEVKPAAVKEPFVVKIAEVNATPADKILDVQVANVKSLTEDMKTKFQGGGWEDTPSPTVSSQPARGGYPQEVPNRGAYGGRQSNFGGQGNVSMQSNNGGRGDYRGYGEQNNNYRGGRTRPQENFNGQGYAQPNDGGRGAFRGGFAEQRGGYGGARDAPRGYGGYQGGGRNFAGGHGEPAPVDKEWDM